MGYAYDDYSMARPCGSAKARFMPFGSDGTCPRVNTRDATVFRFVLAKRHIVARLTRKRGSGARIECEEVEPADFCATEEPLRPFDWKSSNLRGHELARAPRAWNASCSSGARMDPPRILVACADAETLDRLHVYLVGVGMTSRAVRSLEGVLDVSEPSNAVVVFPDGFGVDKVVPWALAVREKWPQLLLLLVTREPQRFSTMLIKEHGLSSLVVLPKPTFGWTIVDVIRVHADGGSS